MPVLFIHGSDDLTVPAFMSQNLYAVAPEPKKIVIIPGADHNNLAQIAPYDYKKAVLSLIEWWTRLLSSFIDISEFALINSFPKKANFQKTSQSNQKLREQGTEQGIGNRE